MPTSLPDSVREHLGEQAAQDLSQWFAENLPQNVVTRDEYREVISRLDVLENEVAGINERLDRMEERFEGRFEQIEGRFDQIDQRFEQQSAQFNQRFDEQSAQFNQRIDAVNERIDRLHEQMRVQTRWTIGTIALFGTILTILQAIAQFGG